MPQRRQRSQINVAQHHPNRAAPIPLARVSLTVHSIGIRPVGKAGLIDFGTLTIVNGRGSGNFGAE